MAEVISLADHRANRKLPTVIDLSRDATDDIMENWANFARNNRLNEFFVQSIGHWAKDKIDYLTNLNELSLVESKIALQQTVYAPGTAGTRFSGLGWSTMFKLNDVEIVTPPMMSEAYARCFSILLYLKLKRELVRLDLIK